jgi:S1-C subfamily serine protease
MLSKEISTPDGKQVFDDFKNADALLPADLWSQGSTAKQVLRGAVKQGSSSLAAVRDANGVVALCTVVEADGLAITKASVLPAEPRCELPDGQIVSAKVLGIEPAFDLALLKVGSGELQPIQWKDTPLPAAGTLLAAIGLQELPLALGVVSVPTCELKGPFPSSVKPPPKRRAAMPELIGSAVQGRGYWVEFVEGRSAEAGIEPGDVLLTIGGRAVRGHQDLSRCVEARWAGEVLTVHLLRAGRPRELTMRLRAEGQSSFSLRADGFPTYFEHDAPLLAHECGGPIVGLDGKALGREAHRHPNSPQ